MDYFKECLKTLEEWISIRSLKDEPLEGKPFGENVYKMLEIALNKGKELGLEVYNREGYAGEICFGEGNDKEGLAILCHLDVVPEGDLKSWKFNPYKLTEDNGYLYGRGIVDDKGAAALVLFVIKELKDSGFIPNRKIKLILGCDEESGWGCMDYYGKNYVIPDEGFSPDGDFPVIYAEKRIKQCQFKFKKPENVIYIEGGERVNVVPDKAIMKLKEPLSTVTDLDVNGTVYTANGKTAHGSTPENGVNAIEKLFYNLYKNNIIEKDVYVNLFKNNLSDIQDESGRLSFSPDIVRTVGDYIEVFVDVRCPVTIDNDLLNKELSKIGNLTVIHEQPPLYVEREDPFLKTFINSYEKVMGEKGEPIAIGGGTYARVLKKGVAFGPNFGNSECHVPNENISIEELKKCYEIYKDVIKELCRQENG